jgi:hypothetical protein
MSSSFKLHHLLQVLGHTYGIMQPLSTLALVAEAVRRTILGSQIFQIIVLAESKALEY